MDEQQVSQTLLDAIDSAASSSKAGTTEQRERAASAARMLAEAWAWLQVPNQPH